MTWKALTLDTPVYSYGSKEFEHVSNEAIK